MAIEKNKTKTTAILFNNNYRAILDTPHPCACVKNTLYKYSTMQYCMQYKYKKKSCEIPAVVT